MWTSWVYIIIVSITISYYWPLARGDNETCAILYEKGVEAYLENNFQDCVKYFELAVEKYRHYTKVLQNCRIKCKDDASTTPFLYREDVDDLHFFEKTIRNTLCILKCRKQHEDIFETYNINKETEKLFENRAPYEYLHVCYFQIEQYLKAASSAFTYLVSHPDDKSMMASLKYYTKNYPEADTNEIVNYEAKEYVYLYVHGSDAYDEKDWKSVVNNMEESLISYLQAEDECRAQCEGPFDPGWYPDFIPSIANHFTYCLRCKAKCKDTLSSLNGEKHDDLVASHYHYLQYAYYKLGKLQAACRAVASYLLFYPEDNDMKRNLEFYKSLPDVKDNFFTPREEAVYYTKRDTYETKLLKFIFKEFDNKKISIAGRIEEISPQIQVVKTSSKTLDEPQRYVAENLLTSRQCGSLIYLAKLFAVQGDGYDNNKTPHSPKEWFGGIALSRLAFLVGVGLVDLDYLKTIIRVTDRARDHLENHFNLPEELYFSYTHLVCRSAVVGAEGNRTGFSHTVHADNCNLHPNGSCEKAYPSYTSRDYSAVIYLNNDFNGGEFVFVSDYKGDEIQSIVKPKCGRMVAFSSGVENLHGVKAVTKGTRCAIGIWFTMDPKEAEDRQYAMKLIENEVV